MASASTTTHVATRHQADPTGRYEQDDWTKFAYEVSNLTLLEINVVGGAIGQVFNEGGFAFKLLSQSTTLTGGRMPCLALRRAFPDDLLEKDGAIHQAVKGICDVNELRYGPLRSPPNTEKALRTYLDRGICPTMLYSMMQAALDITDEQSRAEHEGRLPVMVYPISGFGPKRGAYEYIRPAAAKGSRVVLPISMRLAVMQQAGAVYATFAQKDRTWQPKRGGESVGSWMVRMMDRMQGRVTIPCGRLDDVNAPVFQVVFEYPSAAHIDKMVGRNLAAQADLAAQQYTPSPFTFQRFGGITDYSKVDLNKLLKTPFTAAEQLRSEKLNPWDMRLRAVRSGIELVSRPVTGTSTRPASSLPPKTTSGGGSSRPGLGGLGRPGMARPGSALPARPGTALPQSRLAFGAPESAGRRVVTSRPDISAVPGRLLKRGATASMSNLKSAASGQTGEGAGAGSGSGSKGKGKAVESKGKGKAVEGKGGAVEGNDPKGKGKAKA